MANNGPSVPVPPPPPPLARMTRGSEKKTPLPLMSIKQNLLTSLKRKCEETLDQKNEKGRIRNRGHSNTDEDTKRRNKIEDGYLFACYKTTLLLEFKKLDKVIEELEDYPELEKVVLLESQAILQNFESALNAQHKNVEDIFNAAYMPRKIVGEQVMLPGFVHLIYELKVAIALTTENPNFIGYYQEIKSLQEEYEKATTRVKKNELIQKANILRSQGDLLFDTVSNKLKNTNSKPEKKTVTARPTEKTINVPRRDEQEELSALLTSQLTVSNKRNPNILRGRTLQEHPPLRLNATSAKKIMPRQPERYTSTNEWRSFEQGLQKQVAATLREEKEKDTLKNKEEMIRTKLKKDADAVSIPEKRKLLAKLPLLRSQIEELENRVQTLIQTQYSPFQLSFSTEKEIQLYYVYTLSHPPVMTSSSISQQDTDDKTTPPIDLSGFYIQEEENGLPLPFEECSPDFVPPKKTIGTEWKNVTCPLGFLSESEKQALIDFILPGQTFEAVQKIINLKIQSFLSNETLNAKWILTIAMGLVFRPLKNETDINGNLRLKGSYSVEKLIKADIKDPKEITEATTDLFQKCLIKSLQDKKEIHPKILEIFFEEAKGIFRSLCEDREEEKEISKTIAIDMLLTALPSELNPASFELEENAFDHFYTNEKKEMAREQKKKIIGYAFREKEKIKMLCFYLEQETQIKTNFDEFKKAIEDALDKRPDLKEISKLLLMPDALAQNKIDEKIKAETQRKIAEYLVKNIAVDHLVAALEALPQENKVNFILKSMDHKTLLEAVPIDTLKDLTKQEYNRIKENMRQQSMYQRRKLYLENEEKINDKKKRIAEETAQARKELEAEKTTKDAQESITDINLPSPLAGEDVTDSPTPKTIERKASTSSTLSFSIYKDRCNTSIAPPELNLHDDEVKKNRAC